MWQRQCYDWQRKEKTWVSERRVIGAVRYFLLGLHVGEQPIFDGMCAFCGDLLYGHLGQGALSNKMVGRPVDIQGRLRSGLAAADTQPPFLLRWSPDVFAQMAPDVFTYDPEVNRVGLAEAHQGQPPWKTEMHHRQNDRAASWFYCTTCALHLFAGRHDDVRHVPFRDRASCAHSSVTASVAAASSAARSGTGLSPKLKRKWQQTITRLLRRNRRRSAGLLDVNNLIPAPAQEY